MAALILPLTIMRQQQMSTRLGSTEMTFAKLTHHAWARGCKVCMLSAQHRVGRIVYVNKDILISDAIEGSEYFKQLLLPYCRNRCHLLLVVVLLRQLVCDHFAQPVLLE